MRRIHIRILFRTGRSCDIFVVAQYSMDRQYNWIRKREFYVKESISFSPLLIFELLYQANVANGRGRVIRMVRLVRLVKLYKIASEKRKNFLIEQ